MNAKTTPISQPKAVSSSKPAPLGRGLSALFGDTDAAYKPRTEQAPRPQPQAPEQIFAQGGHPGKIVDAVRQIPIDLIEPGRHQQRRFFDDAQMKELTTSIKVSGVQQPILIRRNPDASNMYEILAGERRWRAAQKAGLHEVPALIRDVSDREAMEIGLLENMQRADLSPIEEAEGYKRLADEFNYSNDQIALRLGKSRSHIANMIRLLLLTDSAKQMVTEGKISAGHARAIAVADDPDRLIEEIVAKNLSVRQTEALAREGSGFPVEKKRRGVDQPSVARSTVALIERDLERMLGLKVKMMQNRNGKSGSLTVFFSDLDQFQMVAKKLME